MIKSIWRFAVSSVNIFIHPGRNMLVRHVSESIDTTTTGYILSEFVVVYQIIHPANASVEIQGTGKSSTSAD